MSLYFQAFKCLVSIQWSCLDRAFYLYGSFAYVNVCVLCLCLVHMEARRGHQIFENWSYRCGPSCECWELNSPLEQQQVLLTLDPSLHSQGTGFESCQLFKIWALSSFCCLVCPPFTTFLYYLVMVIDSYLPAIISQNKFFLL